MAEQSYRTTECIFETDRSRIYRARTLAEDRPVIVKQLRGLYPSAEFVAGFTREFDVTRAAAGEGIIEAYELCSNDGTVSIVLEDFQATSIAAIAAEARPPLIDSLRIVAQVANGLAGVHRNNIVHKDISPGNIVWNRETGVAKLIDFGMSQVLDRALVAAKRFEGTPAYVSPEQTGRMNRVIDCRSDFYSLGATLYAMVTGRPPFTSTDRLELVHAHLAKTPTPPHEVDATIPKPVSDIIMLMLEKRAEDRYQSAIGLRDDLRRCITQLEAGAAIEPFELRAHDIDERLRVPQKLYGRDTELVELRQAFERAAEGRARILLVAGYSGIGKTSLVREVHRSLVGRGANFVEGKFDQFDRGRPYASVLQAFRDLIRLILTEDSETIAAWNERILTAAGDNGRVLTDVIPELTHVIGEQPELATLTPAEARNRFQLVVASFVRAMASADHPLVIFLDDLQWADLPSIDLITKLATDPTSRHVLLVGAYRDNEVGEDHPLTAALAEMRAEGAGVDAIELGPLSEDDVLELVSDTVAHAPGRVRLAVLCQSKTNGNAFFLKRFLESLYEDGLLKFDTELRQWSWDLATIQAHPMTDNVVDFMSAKIRALQPTARACLELAACIGDSFDLKTLAVALGVTRQVAQENLRPSLTAELIHPAQEAFWFVGAVDEDTTNFTCRFSHDRIRQAARALLDEQAATKARLCVGRYLLDNLEASELEQRLFEVVEHLNQGVDLLDDPAEKARLCQLNLTAARRASASAAFPPAYNLYCVAQKLLGDDPWANSYEQALATHVEGARAAYLSAEHDAMELLVQRAVANATTALDRVAALEVKLHALVGAQRFSEALELALPLLGELGVSLPNSPTPGEVEAAVGATLGALQAHDAEAIAALPFASDATVMAAQRIQSDIMSSAYLAVPALFPVLACNLVQTTLKHGVSKESPYGFSVFALLLNTINMLEVAHPTGQMALAMLDRVDEPSVRPKTIHIVACYVTAHVEPIRNATADERHAFRIGMDSGDLEYAAWALHVEVGNGFYAGVDLAELVDVARRNLSILKHHKQMPALNCTLQHGQAIANLMGKADNPARLVGPDYDETSHMAALLEIGFLGAAYIVCTIGTFVRYLFRDIDAAIECADAGRAYADGAAGTYVPVWWHQYRALAVLAQPDAGPGTVESLQDSLEQIRIWAKSAPVNHEHRALMLDAEIARVEGRRLDAMALYDRAVASARAHRFTHEEALANELAGRFHFSYASRTIARAYLLEACYVYDRWGASAKVAQLEGEFAELLAGVTSDSRPGSRAATTTVGSVSASESTAGLDLTTLFKAANLITSEIELDALLGRVLEVAIENAGATRGYLVVDHEGGLLVDSAKDANGNDLVDSGTPIAECDGLPVRVVSYVARTGERLVLDDARDDSRWSEERQLAMDRPTSILCAPIVHQKVGSGIVYLENDLTAGAFTPERTQVLELLCTQAAISIENAQHTAELRAHRDHLEDLVEKRTRALAEANAVLDRLSHTDPLTGLPNRRRFDERFADNWASARRDQSKLSLLMIDVDCFKLYNDNYGHQSGDECLRQVANAISKTLHRATDLVARYGGEEFAAILPGTDAAGALALGESMREAVESLNLSHEYSTAKPVVTISGGVASTIPDNDADATALVEQADQALYRAKQAGRNRFGD